MTDIIIILLFWYSIGAIIWLIVAMLNRVEENRMSPETARLFLTIPIWPAALVAILVVRAFEKDTR